MLEPSVRLRQAIVDGNLLVVKRLLKRFPDMLENVDSENGWSSLHYASYHGRYLICVHLISLGHDKKEVLRSFKGNTSVHLALKNGHEQTTHLLLQHFPKLLDIPGEEGHTPLQVSVIKDYFKCVEMLLAMGAKIQVVDDEGNNALHLAMKYGAVHCIRLLVQYGADTKLKNRHGLKPVDMAASFQVEKYLRDVLSDSPSSDSNDDAVSITLGESPLMQQQQPAHRVHSNSLPPLPSVTTARRSSVTSTSTATKSPVPRSAISLAFNGSNTLSYVYSPQHGPSPNSSKSPSAGLSLSIKPPTGGVTQASPVLYSPSNLTIPVGINPIREESVHLKNAHSLSSFPSMTSISSVGASGGTCTTPSELTRRRTNSQQIQTTTNSISFQRISKTRSNSSGSRSTNTTSSTNGIAKNYTEDKNNTSAESSVINLSRTSTVQSDVVEQTVNTLPTIHQAGRRTPILNLPIIGRVRRD